MSGTISIVGAGPGDAGLLTVRGKELIAVADAVVYDALVNCELLPADAGTTGTPELYYVGKRSEAAGRRRAVSPEEVRQLLVGLVREGKRVVYLVGGDPFVFGRGGEAAQAMHEAGIPFEIVPGVTQGVAVTAYAGIPVTHPGLATSVTFVSGRDDPAKAGTAGASTNWKALAKVGGTVVIYNGVPLLPAIVREMTESGMPGEIPAVAIQAGTRTTQRTVVATLDTLAHEAALAGMSGGATVVIGWNVLLRDEIAWFDTRPLFGKRIAVVQSTQGGSVSGEQLTLQLRELGADVTLVPPPSTARLDLAPVRDDIGQIEEYGWIVFSSPDAVALFWEQLLTLGRDTRALAGIKLAAVGATTAAALLDRGITVDVLPERFEVAALLELLAERSDVAGARVLYVCGEEDDGTVPEGVFRLGADVVMRPVYRLVPGGSGASRIRRRLERGTVDLVVFLAPEAVAQYVRAVGDELATRAPAAVADETTADAVRDAGIELLVELEESMPTPSQLAAAIVRAYNAAGGISSG